MFSTRFLFLFIAGLAIGTARPAEDSPRSNEPVLQLAVFDVDATPPLGSELAYDTAVGTWDLGLRARGVVLSGAGDPIVLCAVDWIGIANGGHDAFCEELAEAAGTKPGRVSVHTLHQHDAPICDFSTESILKESGLSPGPFEGDFQRRFLSDLKAAVEEALAAPQPVTHLGLGKAKVEKVASNRRILGPDGKVRAVRYTSCQDPELRAEPEGVIDPEVSLVSFWNGENPLAVLSYYATHPQSYYRTGVPNPDFPGVARFHRQLENPSALHVHFTGAGGNIGAGKYNDGSKTNRWILADRLADGMKRAWESTVREPISADRVQWTVEPVALPPAEHLSIETLESQFANRDPQFLMSGDARRLAWLRRIRAGHKNLIGCLTLGKARILHFPGELFVEYQLAAKEQKPDAFVALAAYGDYGPGYIGTAIAYEQGGYETQPRSSNVAPKVEGVLMEAIRKLLREESAD